MEIDNTEVLLDNKVSNLLQNAFYSAVDVNENALKQYPQTPVMYTLHYSYPSDCREIPQGILETIYVFRTKLKSVRPLPPKEMYCLKVIRILEKHKTFIDMSIYGEFLNHMRCIIFNRGDSVFYKKVIEEYQRALSGKNEEWDIEALEDKGCKNKNDEVNSAYTRTKKYISCILNDPDFDYVYNGVLQHSDERYWSRYINENEDNSIMYVIYKCAVLADQIRRTLLSDTYVFDEIIKNNIQFLTKN